MNLSTILFSFQGRLNRQPYWLYAVVGLTVVNIVLTVIAVIVLGNQQEVMAVVSLIIAVIILWPAIAMGVKRLHDRNRTGWMFLLLFVPIVQLWPMIEMLFLKGTEGENKYGPDPLAGTA